MHGKKYLERAKVWHGVTYAVISFFFVLVMLWVLAWVSAELLKETLSMISVISLLSGAMVLNHVFISKFPYTGLGTAVGESLGFTAAFGVFFSPLLPPQALLLLWFVLGTVFSLAGLVRVARLKRRGYAERPENETSSSQ